jgi:hypothetical protein
MKDLVQRALGYLFSRESGKPHSLNLRYSDEIERKLSTMRQYYETDNAGVVRIALAITESLKEAKDRGAEIHIVERDGSVKEFDNHP